MKQKNIENKNIDAEETLVKFKETIEISNGTHTGLIRDVTKHSNEFEYLHIGIMITDLKIPNGKEKPVIRIGLPLSMSLKSGLGRLIIKSGFDITKKPEYTLTDIKDLLLNKRVSFTVFTNERDGGIFSEIDKDSITFC